jgi:hypothetical protein
MSMTEAVTITDQLPVTRKRQGWEQIGNAVVLVAYSCVVLFTVRYHEKWGDEAQAWLLARDLGLKTLWFHELRYEGAPGLWHTILWVARHIFHAQYDAIGYIGAAFAIGGVALLVFKSPFPYYIRWPLAFTYFLLYQYAVIARTYTLLPLLCFAIAAVFADIEHPWRITTFLVLLANLSLHGTVLAGCFGLFYLLNGVRRRSSLSSAVRRQYLVCAVIVALTFLFLFIILKPTPDVEEFVMKKEFAQMSDAMKQQIQMPTPAKKAATIISGAFLDLFAPSALFLIMVAAWSYTRRRLLLLAIPVGMMIALYAVIHGAPHHHGTAFVALITAIWIAWPTEQEQALMAPRDVWAMRGITALLLCLCFVNIWDSAVVIKREYLYPYSGAEDAAKYLKSVGADRGPMFGLLWGVVGVQAYFDHKIFANTPTTYFHHGLPLYGRTLDVDLLYRIQPEYIVAYSQDPQLMLNGGVVELTSRGYELVHFSDGYYLYKQAVANREVYLIFHRTGPSVLQTPLQAGPGK